MPNFAPGPLGANSALNITAATVLKAAPGALYVISVIAAGSTAGAAYDATSTTGNSAADQVFVIPANAAAGSFYVLNWHCQNGIVIAPGTGGTLAVLFV